jgi:hypothetical protein
VGAGAAGSQARGAVTWASSPKPAGAATEASERGWNGARSHRVRQSGMPGGDFPSKPPSPTVFYDPAFALAAAPALGARVQAARLWSRPAATAVAGVLSDSPRAPPMDHSGRWRRGWTHAFAPLGTPDRDLADLVIDAFLNGLTGEAGAGPLVLWPFIPEHAAFAAALDRVFAWRGSPNARFGGQKRRPCARRGARRRSDPGPVSPAARGARSPAAPPGRSGNA